MIKNTHVHKVLIFCASLVIFFHIESVTLFIKEFSDDTIAQLRIYEKKYPQGFTVQVKPDQTVMGKITEWGEWITGSAPDNQSLLNWSSFKPFIQYTLGGTVVSYCAIIYIIYRAYYLLKKIGTWTHWLGKEHDDEIILYVRKKEKEHSLLCLSSIKDEIILLERYLLIHKQLEKMHIRWLFPQNKANDEYIAQTVTRLKALERKFLMDEK